eukprot:scaffold296_cov164-Ochromonas_danica.AAC.12
MSNPSIFGTDTFVDSEDLMSWLLLNPEMDFDLPQWATTTTTTTSNNPCDNMLPPLPPQSTIHFANGYDEVGYSSVPSDNVPHQQSLMSSSTSVTSLSMPPVTGTAPVTGTQPQQQQQSIQSLPQVLSSLKQEPQQQQPPQPQSHQPLTVNTGSTHYPHSLASSASQSTLMSTKETTPRGSKKTVASKTATAAAAAAVKKRPRESVEDLEARVNALKAENADLHAHLLNVTQRTTEVQKQRVAMEKLMAQKLAELGDRDDSDQSELANLVKQYTDIYADYGKCRQREQLEKLIVPTTTTKMSLWTLQQDRSFYQRNKSPMYDMLAKELEITPEQTDKIQERREKISSLLNQLRDSLQLLQSLKVAIEKKHASFDAVCGRVQAAATPKQIVQFQMWITKNAEMLGKYIPGFSRTAHHIPNAQFVELPSSTPSSSSSSSAQQTAATAGAGGGRGIKRSSSGQPLLSSANSS